MKEQILGEQNKLQKKSVFFGRINVSYANRTCGGV
jgi:hypothetical protein